MQLPFSELLFWTERDESKEAFSFLEKVLTKKTAMAKLCPSQKTSWPPIALSRSSGLKWWEQIFVFWLTLNTFPSSQQIAKSHRFLRLRSPEITSSRRLSSSFQSCTAFWYTVGHNNFAAFSRIRAMYIKQPFLLHNKVQLALISHFSPPIPFGNPHRLLKRQSLTTVLLRTPITQMIFFNQSLFVMHRVYYSYISCLLYTSPSPRDA